MALTAADAGDSGRDSRPDPQIFWANLLAEVKLIVTMKVEGGSGEVDGGREGGKEGGGNVNFQTITYKSLQQTDNSPSGR